MWDKTRFLWKMVKHFHNLFQKSVAVTYCEALSLLRQYRGFAVQSLCRPYKMLGCNGASTLRGIKSAKEAAGSLRWEYLTVKIQNTRWWPLETSLMTSVQVQHMVMFNNSVKVILYLFYKHSWVIQMTHAWWAKYVSE